MPNPPKNSNYLVSWFFIGLFSLGALAILLNILWEIQTGITHQKTGGLIVRAIDPNGFWTDIVLQGGFALLFAGLAVGFCRFD